MPRKNSTDQRSPSSEDTTGRYRGRSRSTERHGKGNSGRNRMRSPDTAHGNEVSSFHRKEYHSKNGDRSREKHRHRTRRPRSPSSDLSRSRSPQSHHKGRRRRRSRDHGGRDSRSRSPRRNKDRHKHSRSRSPMPFKRSKKPLPPQEDSFRGEDGHPNGSDPPKPKEKPNLQPTGLLAAETNKVTTGSGKSAQSIVLKYHEPPEARKPPSAERWTMYVFKGASKDPLHTYHLHERTCWLLGRELSVADIATEHPSCSKQHAVLQFRHTQKKNEWGEKKSKVGLYLLDLESANGTFLNEERIDAARYTQLLAGDIVKFGESEREYVIILPSKESAE